MNERQERVGRNEALFRQVNERLREIGESFSLVAEKADFICECGDASCAEPIRMTLADYERIRADGALFFIRRGHEVADVEAVVEERDGYVVVRKHEGRAADFARQENPRQ